MADITENTVDGLLAFCDWLAEKGYAPTSQIEPWKTAAKKIFQTVEGEDYGSLSLDNVDLDDYINRFRVLAASQYKHESIRTYGARLKNAVEAHAYFREHGRPQTFRQAGKRTNGDGQPTPKAAQAKTKPAKPTGPSASTAPGTEFFDLEYPLESGRLALLRLPKRMSKNDVDRLSTVLRTLQNDEQRQIPQHTGEEKMAAYRC